MPEIADVANFAISLKGLFCVIISFQGNQQVSNNSDEDLELCYYQQIYSYFLKCADHNLDPPYPFESFECGPGCLRVCTFFTLMC
jgi:hypothetical protein